MCQAPSLAHAILDTLGMEYHVTMLMSAPRIQIIVISTAFAQTLLETTHARASLRLPGMAIPAQMLMNVCWVRIIAAPTLSAPIKSGALRARVTWASLEMEPTAMMSMSVRPTLITATQMPSARTHMAGTPVRASLDSLVTVLRALIITSVLIPRPMTARPQDPGAPTSLALFHAAANLATLEMGVIVQMWMSVPCI
jgi:hypothetical protein